jgi:hypothetical protein
MPMTATYSWTLTSVNPDDVHRALQRRNAVKSTEDLASATYQLVECRVEVFSGSFPVLLITGSTDESVRDTAVRLGYDDSEGTVTEVKDEVSARR